MSNKKQETPFATPETSRSATATLEPTEQPTSLSAGDTASGNGATASIASIAGVHTSTLTGGLPFTPKRRGIEHLPGGGIRMEIVIQVEEAMLLESWAESAGEPLESYIQTQVDESLKAYCSAQG